MKKRTLVLGLAAFLALAMVFTSCGGAADGHDGDTYIGGIVLQGPAVTDTDLAAAFAESGARAVYEGNVLLASAVTSVYGEVPASRKLIVLGATAVATSETLTVKGTLEVAASASFDGAASAGTSGTVIFADGATATLAAGGQFYAKDTATLAKVSGDGIKAVGVASGTTGSIAALFGDASTLAIVGDVTTLAATDIPQGKTLILRGDGNTATAFDGSATTVGRLIIPTGAKLTATTSIKGNATTPNIIIDGGTLEQAAGAFALNAGVDLSNGTFKNVDSTQSTATIAGNYVIKSLVNADSDGNFIIAKGTEATTLTLGSITPSTTYGVQMPATVFTLKSLDNETDGTVLFTQAANVTGIATANGVTTVTTATFAPTGAVTIGSAAKLDAAITGATAAFFPFTQIARLASGASIQYAATDTAAVNALTSLSIPAGVTVSDAGTVTWAALATLSVDGTFTPDSGFTNTTPASLTVTGNGTIDVSAATVAIPIITKLTGAKTVKVGTVSSASADLTVAAGSKVVVATSYVIKEGQKITLGEGSTVVVGTSTGANLLISGAGDYAATAGEITLAPATGLEFDDPSTLAIPISGGVYFDYDALATTSLTAGGSVLALLGGTSGGSVGITNAGSGGTAIVATSATAATVTGTTNASTGDVITFTGTLSLTTGATAAGVSITKAIVDLSGGGSVVLNPGTILTMTAGSAAGEGAGFFLNAAGAGKATMGKLISTSTRGNSDTAIKLAAATTTATNVFMDADNTAGYISSTVASTTTTVTAGATISASTTFVEDANANNSDSTDLNTAGLVILGVATNNG